MNTCGNISTFSLVDANYDYEFAKCEYMRSGAIVILGVTCWIPFQTITKAQIENRSFCTRSTPGSKLKITRIRILHRLRPRRFLTFSRNSPESYSVEGVLAHETAKSGLKWRHSFAACFLKVTPGLFYSSLNQMVYSVC
jgi:hypothetical protein